MVEMESSTRDRQTRKLKRRRVIERPRLFALLDESPNRIRTLVAPAGYGKTTLAEQWVARDGRRGAWFKARSASTDVAALALGMARAAAELVPGCDERLRAHLRAVPNPGERVDVLAEILGEELAGWSPADWLVLDEYQELVGADDAEAFVDELAAACPVRLLIASRQRPTWVTGRRILYGDVLELNQTVLAMDTREAAELLEGRSAASASGLVALANGWPAVIALASVTDAEIDGDAEVPDSLYRFFAEEVFEALGEDVRAGLATLAIAPVLDRELAAALLDDRRASLRGGPSGRDPGGEGRTTRASPARPLVPRRPRSEVQLRPSSRRRGEVLSALHVPTRLGCSFRSRSSVAGYPRKSKRYCRTLSMSY